MKINLRVLGAAFALSAISVTATYGYTNTYGEASRISCASIGQSGSGVVCYCTEKDHINDADTLIYIRAGEGSSSSKNVVATFDSSTDEGCHGY